MKLWLGKQYYYSHTQVYIYIKRLYFTRHGYTHTTIIHLCEARTTVLSAYEILRHLRESCGDHLTRNLLRNLKGGIPY